MTQSTLQSRQSERGFTLVELAIVMIIIGLLIGGILKGQELINNARVSSTAAQAKAIESGISTFRDKYAGLPGDLANPLVRLPVVAGSLIATAPTVGTLGNGAIENTGAVLNPGLTVNGVAEAGQAFQQMAAAGMIGGVNPAATAVGIDQTNPATPIAGAWVMGTTAGVATTGMIFNTGLAQGVYIASSPAVGANVPATDAGVFTPIQASAIDRKLDDGQPNSGNVRATGIGGAAANCASTNTAVGLYNEINGAAACGLYVKVM